MSNQDQAHSVASAREDNKPGTQVRLGSRVVPVLLLALTAILFLANLEPVGGLPPASNESQEIRELRQQQSDGGMLLSWPWLWAEIKVSLYDVPVFLAAQWNVIKTILIWSLIPGLAGLIYRRSFLHWFALAFFILYAIHRLAPFLPFGSFGGIGAMESVRPYDFYLAIEGLLILLLLAFRLSWRDRRLVDLIEMLMVGLLVSGNLLWKLLKSGARWIKPSQEGSPVKAWLFVPLKGITLILGLVIGLVLVAVAAIAWLPILLYLGLKWLISQLGAMKDVRKTLIKKSKPEKEALKALRELGETGTEEEKVKWLEKLDKQSRGKVQNVRKRKEDLTRFFLQQLVLQLSRDGAIDEFQVESINRGITAVFSQSKNIVVCLDGTWNEPGQLDFGHHAETNVLKLFGLLKTDEKTGFTYSSNASMMRTYGCQSETSESEAAGGQPDSDLREELSSLKDDTSEAMSETLSKAASRLKKEPKQIAFYYRGVGNKADNNPLAQKFGGAFGFGASSIVDRAYLDVARVWKPGDRIFIFGFSRGAAIARLLAGTIGRRRVPTHIFTLRLFGRNFAVWKSRKKRDEENPISVEILGCWDTVGAFGISKNIMGIPFQKIDLLKDLTVTNCVKRAYHMVAIDETRDAFVPTLMDRDPVNPKRIIEVWFAGNHANVGGGYATDRLSDITLSFLLKRVSSGYAHKTTDTVPGREDWGLYLDAVEKDSAHDPTPGIVVIDPDPKGRIRHSTGPIYKHEPREMPFHAIIHKSVFERIADTDSKYAPQSLIDLNRRFLEERYKVETALIQMAERSASDPRKKNSETDEALSPEEVAAELDYAKDIPELSDLKVFLMKRSTGTITPAQFNSAMKWARSLKMKQWEPKRAKELNPAEELNNLS